MEILKTILSPFIWIAKFIAKSALRIIVTVVAIYLVFHYLDIYQYIEKDRVPTIAQVVIDYSHENSPSDVVKDVWKLNPIKDISLPSFDFFSSENILTINTDSTSEVGAILDYDDGGSGVVVYTTNYGGVEKVNKMVAHSKKGHTAVMDIDPATLLPTKMEIEGYTYTYHQFTNLGVDISVTDPEGNTSEVQNILFDQEFAQGNWFAPTAHAGVISWVAGKIGKFMTKSAAAAGINVIDFDDTMDFQLWSEYINKVENIAVCGVGIATIWVPNPVSATAIAWGCGNYLADNIPQYVSVDAVDICKTQDLYTGSCTTAVINGVQGITTSTPPSKLYLRGRVTVSGGNSLETAPATLTFINRKGKGDAIVKNVTRNYGFVGGPAGATLTLGTYDVYVEAPGYIPRQFTLAFVPDYRILIKEGDEIDYTQELHWPKSPFWKVKLSPIEEEDLDEDDSESTAAFDGTWKGSGTGYSLTEANDYREECERTIPFTLEIIDGKVKGSVDIEVKYNVFDISGRVTSDGSMSGKVKALKLITLGTFDVNFESNTAEGAWTSERFECSGTVTLRKQ